MNPRNPGLPGTGHLGLRSGKPRDPEPPKVEACHVDYALARRPRMSWQAIGQQIGVNPESLRIACERAEAAPPARVAPVPPKPVEDQPALRVQAGSAMASALLAMADGVATRAGLAKRLGLSADACGVVALKLQTKRLIDGAWTLTEDGEAHVRRLRSGRHG